MFYSGKRKDQALKETKKFDIVEEVPSWEDSESLNVRKLECEIPPVEDLKDIKAGIDAMKHKWHRETIKKADNPFSQATY